MPQELETTMNEPRPIQYYSIDVSTVDHTSFKPVTSLLLSYQLSPAMEEQSDQQQAFDFDREMEDLTKRQQALKTSSHDSEHKALELGKIEQQKRTLAKTKDAISQANEDGVPSIVNGSFTSPKNKATPRATVGLGIDRGSSELSNTLRRDAKGKGPAAMSDSNVHPEIPLPAHYQPQDVLQMSYLQPFAYYPNAMPDPSSQQVNPNHETFQIPLRMADREPAKVVPSMDRATASSAATSVFNTLGTALKKAVFAFNLPLTVRNLKRQLSQIFGLAGLIDRIFLGTISPNSQFTGEAMISYFDVYAAATAILMFDGSMWASNQIAVSTTCTTRTGLRHTTSTLSRHAVE